MSCALIIPARAGSKGVPHKNIRPLDGVPLIAHMIKAAQNAQSVDRIYVSTDGDDIAAVALEYGAEVIRRPDDISGDIAASEDAILHTLDRLGEMGVLPEKTFFAQCTAPLTRSEDFDGAMVLMDKQGYDSIFAAKPFHGFIWGADERGFMHGTNHDHTARRLMRQEMSPEYQETGAFYLFDTAGFRKIKRRFFGRIGVYEIPTERSIDIDTMDDFAQVEAYLRQNV